jgi:hypothetical protein
MTKGNGRDDPHRAVEQAHAQSGTNPIVRYTCRSDGGIRGRLAVRE